mmetsp:Transcript_32891/g.115510  ORF Transcript_32891/g.115510 Transcript_32891/m.115510 type:complete len:206 (-) Transcript_32891:41-658(-)
MAALLGHRLGMEPSEMLVQVLRITGHDGAASLSREFVRALQDWDARSSWPRDYEAIAEAESMHDRFRCRYSQGRRRRRRRAPRPLSRPRPPPRSTNNATSTRELTKPHAPRRPLARSGNATLRRNQAPLRRRRRSPGSKAPRRRRTSRRRRKKRLRACSRSAPSSRADASTRAQRRRKVRPFITAGSHLERKKSLSRRQNPDASS